MARKSRKPNSGNKQVVVENKPIFKTAIYVRLSKEDSGKKDSDSIENQIHIINEFIKNNEDLKSEKVYIDNGETGTNFDRPQFKAMMKDINSSKINCIVVKDLSRFGRDYVAVGEYLYDTFPNLNIRFISINDTYDSFINNTVEELVLSLKNLVNYSYSKDISKKVTSALRVKQENGEFIGGVPPYGYKKSKENKNKLVIDEVTKGTVNEVFELRAKGISFKKIAKILNEKGIPSPKKYYIDIGYIKKYDEYDKLIWGESTIKNITTSEVYIGNMAQRKSFNNIYSKPKYIDKKDWIVVTNTHKPIIERGLWGKVQEVNIRVLKKYGEKYYQNRYQHKENIFRELIQCGDCGKNYVRLIGKRSGTANYRYTFKCGDRAKRINLDCKTNLISEESLIEIILSAINQKLNLVNQKEYSFNYEKLKLYEDKYSSILQEIKKIKLYKRNLFETYENEVIELDEYKVLYNKYNFKLDNLIIDRDKNNSLLLSEKNKIIESEKVLEKLKNQRNIKALTKDILTLFIKKIIIYEDNRIEIIWKFKNIFE